MLTFLRSCISPSIISFAKRTSRGLTGVSLSLSLSNRSSNKTNDQLFIAYVLFRQTTDQREYLFCPSQTSLDYPTDSGEREEEDDEEGEKQWSDDRPRFSRRNRKESIGEGTVPMHRTIMRFYVDPFRRLIEVY
jgi:hypothetical protein